MTETLHYTENNELTLFWSNYEDISIKMEYEISQFLLRSFSLDQQTFRLGM